MIDGHRSKLMLTNDRPHSANAANTHQTPVTTLYLVASGVINLLRLLYNTFVAW